MLQQIRIVLKAFALGRYLLSHQRLYRLSISAMGVIKGENSVAEMSKIMLPWRKGSLRESFSYSRVKKRRGWYAVCLALVGITSFEYYTHRDFVPIINRKHFVVIPREMELKYQQSFINTLMSMFQDGNVKIVDESDERVIFIQGILSQLKEACVYFSPECEKYMKNMKVIVIERNEINAYTTMGPILVVYTGLIDYFMEKAEIDHSIKVEDYIAGVLAHELSHCLSRHPVESLLRWTGWCYYLYILLIPDFIVMPIIKGLFDKRLTRLQEHEADLLALYLLKRSGYSDMLMIQMLSLLPSEEYEKTELVSMALESIHDHPCIENRVNYLREKMDWFGHDFEERYSIAVVSSYWDDFMYYLLKFIRFGL